MKNFLTKIFSKVDFLTFVLALVMYAPLFIYWRQIAYQLSYNNLGRHSLFYNIFFRFFIETFNGLTLFFILYLIPFFAVFILSFFIGLFLNNRKLRIIIAAFISLIVFSSADCLFAPSSYKECDHKEIFCEGQENGTRCSYGFYCDKKGRFCKGPKCPKPQAGRCQNGMCLSLLKFDICSITGSDGKACTVGGIGGFTCPADVYCSPLGPVAGKCQGGACVPLDKETEKKIASSSKAQIFENQYLKIAIPDGWKLIEATQTIQDQTYDKATGKTTPVGVPVIEKTGAVNITKDNYILYVNPWVEQVSGIIGGRFDDICAGAPSADAVITMHPSGSCGFSETSAVSNGNLRVDSYANNQEKREWCVSPSNGSTVWYFSYITDSRGGYFNYYKQGPESGLFGWVATMTYDSGDVNKLPIKSSSKLNVRFPAGRQA